MGRKKQRRNVTVDPEVDEAIDEHPDAFSPFVNRVARIKYVEGRGHAVEQVLTDELEEEIKDHILTTESKLEAMREQADEMRKRADSVEEAADEVERELDELRGLVDDAVESAEMSIEADEEDITATSLADESTWDGVVESLGDMPYETLAWHREDGGSPPGKAMEHTATVNAALENQAEKLGVHHDKILDKLVEEGHVTREGRFESTKSLDTLESEDESM